MVGIKGMKMPKNCLECKLFHFYFDLNVVVHCVCKCRNMEIYGDLDKINDLCPLIEIESEEMNE